MHSATTPKKKTVYKTLSTLDIRIISASRHDDGMSLEEMLSAIDDVEGDAVRRHASDLASAGILVKSRAGSFRVNDKVLVQPESERPGSRREVPAPSPLQSWAAGAARRILQTELTDAPKTVDELSSETALPRKVMATIVARLVDLGEMKRAEPKGRRYRLTEGGGLKDRRLSRQDDLTTMAVFVGALSGAAGETAAKAMLAAVVTRELGRGGEATARALALAVGNAPQADVDEALASLLASGAVSAASANGYLLAAGAETADSAAGPRVRLGGRATAAQAREIVIDLIGDRMLRTSEIASALDGRVGYARVLSEMTQNGDLIALEPAGDRDEFAYVVRGAETADIVKAEREQDERKLLRAMRLSRLHTRVGLAALNPSPRLGERIDDLVRQGFLEISIGHRDERIVLTRRGSERKSRPANPMNSLADDPLEAMSPLRRKCLLAIHVLEEPTIRQIEFALEYHVRSMFEDEVAAMRAELAAMERDGLIVTRGRGMQASRRLSARSETMLEPIDGLALWNADDLDYISTIIRNAGHKTA